MLIWRERFKRSISQISHFTHVTTQFVWTTFMWRVKRACKSCAAINPVSLWPVRSASKTRNWDSERFVRTWVYLRPDPMHASKSVIVARESLTFSLLKDPMSPSTPRLARTTTYFTRVKSHALSPRSIYRFPTSGRTRCCRSPECAVCVCRCTCNRVAAMTRI